MVGHISVGVDRGTSRRRGDNVGVQLTQVIVFSNSTLVDWCAPIDYDGSHAI